MKYIKILVLAFIFTIPLSHAQDKVITEEDVLEAKIAAFYAQFNQLFYTKYIFKAAFEEADHLSKTNEQLLNFANFQMSSIQIGYEGLDMDLSKDLLDMSEGRRSKMTLDALDSLCVANKFIEKYSRLKHQYNDLQSEDSKALSKGALKFQTQIENIIKITESPLNDIECKKLF